MYVILKHKGINLMVKWDTTDVFFIVRVYDTPSVILYYTTEQFVITYIYKSWV